MCADGARPNHHVVWCSVKVGVCSTLSLQWGQAHEYLSLRIFYFRFCGQLVYVIRSDFFRLLIFVPKRGYPYSIESLRFFPDLLFGWMLLLCVDVVVGVGADVGVHRTDGVFVLPSAVSMILLLIAHIASSWCRKNRGQRQNV